MKRRAIQDQPELDPKSVTFHSFWTSFKSSPGTVKSDTFWVPESRSGVPGLDLNVGNTRIVYMK